MYRFIESIRLEEGKLPYLNWHQQRVDHTLHHFGSNLNLRLEEQISLKNIPEKGVHKLRVVYGDEGVVSIETSVYSVKLIKSFKLVELPDSIEYAFKYEDRGWLANLLADAGTDDVLMHRRGKLMDASYANIALYLNGVWLTPRNPLLQGTCRSRMLEEGMLIEEELSIEDLHQCLEMRWINAMIPWEQAPSMQQKTIREMITI